MPELGWTSYGDVVWLTPFGPDWLAAHLRPDGEECERSPRALDVSSGLHHHVVPGPLLTVEPSFLCDGCGLHGWIRDGSWVAA